jgi:hypothetical protein
MNMMMVMMMKCLTMKTQTLSQTALVTQVVVQNPLTAASAIMFQYFGKLGKIPSHFDELKIGI